MARQRGRALASEPLDGTFIPLGEREKERKGVRVGENLRAKAPRWQAET